MELLLRKQRHERDLTHDMSLKTVSTFETETFSNTRTFNRADSL